eukprot:1693168-Amphidinium_carterae.2
MSHAALRNGDIAPFVSYMVGVNCKAELQTLRDQLAVMEKWETRGCAISCSAFCWQCARGDAKVSTAHMGIARRPKKRTVKGTRLARKCRVRKTQKGEDSFVKGAAQTIILRTLKQQWLKQLFLSLIEQSLLLDIQNA